MNSGTWVLGGYRFASLILLPFILKASISIPEFILTHTSHPTPPPVDRGELASQLPWSEQAMPSRGSLIHLPGLAFWFEVSWGARGKKLTKTQPINTAKAWGLWGLFSILYSEKDQSLWHLNKNEGEDNYPMWQTRASNNSPTCSKVPWVPLSCMHFITALPYTPGKKQIQHPPSSLDAKFTKAKMEAEIAPTQYPYPTRFRIPFFPWC